VAELNCWKDSRASIQGYSESPDGGNVWQHPDEGLEHHYLWGLAVDPDDPDPVIVSAASSPGKAHDHGDTPGHAELESFIYRKSGDGPWQRDYEGLPAPEGTFATVLATGPKEPHVFYALTNKGLYQSPEAGLSWQSLNVPWHEYYLY
jgi:hypothetical protein